MSRDARDLLFFGAGVLCMAIGWIASLAVGSVALIVPLGVPLGVATMMAAEVIASRFDQGDTE